MFHPKILITAQIIPKIYIVYSVLADPALTIQNEILPEPALPAAQPALPVAQPALPAAQPALLAAQPVLPAAQPALPAEAAAPQQPFAVIQPLTIGGVEPVPAVPAPVPASGVFKPQFEFFANDLSGKIS